MTHECLTFAGTITAEGRRIKGSVQIAGNRTPRNGEMWEVDLNALHRADRRGAVLVVGHQAFDGQSYDPLRTVARLDNESLRVTPTATGFDYETDELPNTTYANDLLELADKGVLGGTSFDIFGLRSKVTVEPGNIRVRRFTSIAKFGAVTPVVEPAFPSTVEAFAKETGVDDPIQEAPVTEAPPAKREPVTFSKGEETADSLKSGKDHWVEFASELETETIQGQMDAMFTQAQGDLRGDVLDRYEGFAQVLRDRKRTSAAAKARIEAMQFEHNARMNRLPAAPEPDLLASDDYRNAWFGKGGYARTGDANVLAQFAQSIAGDGTQGGYLVPESSLNRITERRKAYGGVQRYAENITTSDGRTLPWPTNDDTGNSAAIATEGSAVASGGADLVLGEISLSAYSYDATGTSNLPLAVSKELLQDAAFDVEALVTRKLGERLGRKIAADLATADGSSKPKGLFNKSADVMTATTLYAAFVEHEMQVDQAYRETGNCRWMFSDTTLAKVRNSVDGNGRPLFVPANDSGGQAGLVGYILGYPVALDQGAGAYVAFGDIYLGYIVRNVRGVTVDVDPYTLISKRQIAFHAWERVDGQIQDSYAVSVSSYSGVSADS